MVRISEEFLIDDGIVEEVLTYGRNVRKVSNR